MRASPKIPIPKSISDWPIFKAQKLFIFFAIALYFLLQVSRIPSCGFRKMMATDNAFAIFESWGLSKKDQAVFAVAQTIGVIFFLTDAIQTWIAQHTKFYDSFFAHDDFWKAYENTKQGTKEFYYLLKNKNKANLIFFPFLFALIVFQAFSKAFSGMRNELQHVSSAPPGLYDAIYPIAILSTLGSAYYQLRQAKRILESQSEEEQSDWKRVYAQYRCLILFVGVSQAVMNSAPGAVAPFYDNGEFKFDIEKVMMAALVFFSGIAYSMSFGTYQVFKDEYVKNKLAESRNNQPSDSCFDIKKWTIDIKTYFKENSFSKILKDINGWVSSIGSGFVVPAASLHAVQMILQIIGVKTNDDNLKSFSENAYFTTPLLYAFFLLLFPGAIMQARAMFVTSLNNGDRDEQDERRALLDGENGENRENNLPVPGSGSLNL